MRRMRARNITRETEAQRRGMRAISVCSRGEEWEETKFIKKSRSGVIL